MNFKQEIIGHKVKDPFEVLREYNDEKCQKLFTALLDYLEDKLLIQSHGDMLLFGKSEWNLEWNETKNKLERVYGMRDMTKEEREIWNELDNDISEIVEI